MENRESLRKRLDNIKEMTDKEAALSRLAEIQWEIGISACDERRELEQAIQFVRKILIGNGDPSTSVLHRVTAVEQSLKGVKTDTSVLTALLLGEIRKDGTVSKGLIDEMRHVANLKKTIDRVTWIIVTVGVGELLLRLFGIL